jgi:hypothetical protein
MAPSQPVTARELTGPGVPLPWPMRAATADGGQGLNLYARNLVSEEAKTSTRRTTASRIPRAYLSLGASTAPFGMCRRDSFERRECGSAAGLKALSASKRTTASGLPFSTLNTLSCPSRQK